jgi:hypothetical protein
MRWATETGADAGTARTAIAFLKADIASVAGEFDLLAAGVVDTDRGVTSQPIKIPQQSPERRLRNAAS